MSSEESSSLSPASRVLAIADQVADEADQIANGVDNEGQHHHCSSIAGMYKAHREDKDLWVLQIRR